MTTDSARQSTSGELLRLWTKQLIRAEFHGTKAGVAWIFVQPLLMALVFTVAFSAFARVSSNGEPYALSFLAGYVPWTFFVEVVNKSSRSVISNANLMSHFSFRRHLVVLSIILSKLVDLTVGIVVIFGLMLWYGQTPSWRIVFVVPVLGGFALLAAGVGLFLATATAKYRDISNLLQPAIRSLFYLSPIIYPIETIPDQYLDGYLLNPIAAFTVGIRDSIFRDELRYPGSLALAFATSIVVFGIGLAFFSHHEADFSDIR
ncbi:MAG: ABC transporter permease [Acidimicrobiales bacterium]